MKKFLFLVLLISYTASAQESLLLDSCYSAAQKHYPKLRNSDLWKEIKNLRVENIKSTNRPQVTLKGTASYQSDVTKLPITLPGINIPSVTNDRYNLYAEMQQTLWDGGINRANQLLEEHILQTQLSSLEVELYQLKEQVAHTFFTAIIARQQRSVLQEQQEALKARLQQLEAAYKHGLVEESAPLVLQAEITRLDQQIRELNTARTAALNMLAVLTGKEIREPILLQYKDIPGEIINEIARPELKLFETQQQQLHQQKELLTAARRPHLFAFGQVGYGKPGLNMLENVFKGYYLVGAGLSWKVFDWKTTTNKKRMLQLQQQMIQHQEKTFRQNIELLLTRQEQNIIKFQALLADDEKIVQLRQKITKAAASKLENQLITASDYIAEVQAETIAKINREIHLTQLREAQERYRFISGNLQP